jgi:hypothetical protein
MKSNPYQLWRVEFWGEGDLYFAANVHERIDGAFAEADELESQLEWPVKRVVIAAQTASAPAEAQKSGTAGEAR